MLVIFVAIILQVAQAQIQALSSVEFNALKPTRSNFECLLNYKCELKTDSENLITKLEPISALVNENEVRFSINAFGFDLTTAIDRESLRDSSSSSFELSFEDEYGDIHKQSAPVIPASQRHVKQGMDLSKKSATLKIYRLVYILPIRVPCWVRWIHITFFGVKLKFPTFGWGRRCCKVKSGFGSWYSTATGCYAGPGPFITAYQCERTCGPFYVEPPPPTGEDCVLGNVTWTDGRSEANCAGTTCTCNDGVITCDDCRQRYEIHDVHDTADPSTPTTFEQRIVDSLIWVSDGCKISGTATCPDWLKTSFANHLTFGGVAHGNSQFFPWHRAYLKTLEEKMQQFHPCVTMPWWDWTQDQTAISPYNFKWTSVVSEGNEGLWGHINGNSAQMGSFETDATNPSWDLPSGWPVGSRSSSMNPSSSLPSSGTVFNYLARSSFGSPGNFKAFEGPHGSPHVMIGGNMGGGRSPADPIFWLHHAGVDRLWYDWQALHAPGTDYDANPTVVLSPFTYTPNDVFDSRNDLGVCYAPAGTDIHPSGPGASRRRLATAIEYGLIASLISVSTIRANLANLENKVAASRETCTDAPTSSECGSVSDCYICLDADNSICADSWSDNMFMDPVAVAQEACEVTSFNTALTAAGVKAVTYIKELEAERDRLITNWANPIALQEAYSSIENTCN